MSPEGTLVNQAVVDALKTITAGNAAAWFRHSGYQGTVIVEWLECCRHLKV